MRAHLADEAAETALRRAAEKSTDPHLAVDAEIELGELFVKRPLGGRMLVAGGVAWVLDALRDAPQTLRFT